MREAGKSGLAFPTAEEQQWAKGLDRLGSQLVKAEEEVNQPASNLERLEILPKNFPPRPI
jgi:hypothetical protein